MGLSFWTNSDPPGPEPLRNPYRLLLGSAAVDEGRFDYGSSWLSAEHAHWHIRDATLAVGSPIGGKAILAFSRASDVYRYFGAVVWSSGLEVEDGDKIGHGSKIYIVEGDGALGSTPPTHASGSATNGAVTLTFQTWTYAETIGVSAVVIHDVADGTSSWPFFGEGQLWAPGGVLIGFELDTGNDAGDCVGLSSWNVFRQNAAHGFSSAAAASDHAPAYPSAAAFMAYRGNQAWLRALLVENDAVFGTDGVTGLGTAIELSVRHVFAWQAADGPGSSIYSTVTSTANRVTQQFLDNLVRFYGAGGNILASFEHLTNGVNFPRFIPGVTGGRVELRSGSLVDANVGWNWNTKGAGDHQWQIGNATKMSLLADALNLASGLAYKIGGVKVLGARETGWSPMTGTTDKASALDVSTVTLAQLAARVAALQAAHTNHGQIGA